jgi:hypothetical protein
MAKWTVALYGKDIHEGNEALPQLGDIIAYKKYKKNEIQWTENEKKNFIIIVLDGFSKKEMQALTNYEKEGVNVKRWRKYQLDIYHLQTLGLDIKKVKDGEIVYQPLEDVVIKNEKIKEKKDK